MRGASVQISVGVDGGTSSGGRRTYERQTGRRDTNGCDEMSCTRYTRCQPESKLYSDSSWVVADALIDESVHSPWAMMMSNRQGCVVFCKFDRAKR